MPDQDFYGSIDTNRQPEAIARLFTPPVWSVRKCSWTDFEARSDFAELVIESCNPVLVHGPVTNLTVNIVHIIEPLVAAGLFGTFESYDEAQRLMLKKAFGTPAG